MNGHPSPAFLLFLKRDQAESRQSSCFKQFSEKKEFFFFVCVPWGDNRIAEFCTVR
jgi:hypothetical protein